MSKDEIQGVLRFAQDDEELLQPYTISKTAPRADLLKVWWLR